MRKMDKNLAAEMLSLVRKEEGVSFVLEEAQWDNEICHLALPYLREDAIVFVLKKKDFHIPLLELAFRILKLAEREEEDLLHFLEKTSYHVVVCEKIVPILSTKKKIHVLERCSYADSVVFSAMPIGEEKDIMFALAKNGFSLECCERAIPFLREEKNILLLMKECAYAKDVVQAAKDALL